MRLQTRYRFIRITQSKQHKELRLVKVSGQESIDQLNCFYEKDPIDHSYFVYCKHMFFAGAASMGLHGRIIENGNVSANSTVKFGVRYLPGTYLVKLINGKEHKNIKLVNCLIK